MCQNQVMANPGNGQKARTAFDVVWRIAVFVGALGLALGALVAFGFGRCHDEGGFCAQEFSSTHVKAYASAAVLGALAAATAVVPFSRRPVPLAVAAFAAAGLVALLAVRVESVT